MTSFISRRTQLATLAVASVLLSVFTTIALAQTPSLADLAKKEQERRKATGTATKVITDKDLPKPATPPAAVPAALPAAVAPADEKKAEEKKPEGEAKDETYWRTRMVSAREQLRRAEMFGEALQTRINALSTDFVNRDDPYQRAKIAEDRQKALSEMERVTTDIEKAKKEIADIEEQARQAGVPPGWLR